MNIVILHTDFRIYWPARLIALNQFLLAKGHILTVIEIAGKGSPYSFAEHVDISDFPAWKILFPNNRIEDISPLKAQKAIFNILNDLEPDVLISGAIAFYSGANALRWSWFKNKPLVIFDNARKEDVKRSKIVNFTKTQLYKLVDSIICPAPSHASSFDFWGFKTAEVFYGLNCVDNVFFENGKKTDKLKSVLPDNYFLTVGRQVQKKNIHILIKSYKLYLNEISNTPIPLVIIGDGPLNNLLKILAGALIDKLIFFLPFQTQNDLLSIYSNAKVYILPSLFGETWGLSVNEAMNCSKPIIVSNQCGCSDTLVKENVNGWKFNPYSASELSHILLKVHQKGEGEIFTMGNKSKEIINQWGIDRFVSGTWEAVEYAKKNKSNKHNLYLPAFLSLFWLGRFRTEFKIKDDIIQPPKHVVVLHTDLRIYWHSRLKDLNKICLKTGIKLTIIEIAGKGSPYSFENKKDRNFDDLNWQILFPNETIDSLDSSKIQRAIQIKLKVLNPDIVIAGALAFPSGAGALKWKSRTNKPIIIFDDARPFDVKRTWVVNKLKEVFYKNVDAVLCPAPSHAGGFNEWGIKSEEIFYGLDVIDNNYFRQIKNSGSDENENLLAVGRQVEKKNWITLLNAFIRFKNTATGSNLKLIFIGDGPLHKQLVKIADNRQDIIFQKFVQQSELVDYYQSAKGLVLPSFYGETWGLVVNEAMAAGLPVLVSEECGCADTLIKDSVNGWTFNPHNIENMIHVIRKLDNLTQSQFEQMSQASTQIINEWGLSRFSQGVFDSLAYIIQRHKKKKFWLANILSTFWDGRYRPV